MTLLALGLKSFLLTLGMTTRGALLTALLGAAMTAGCTRRAPPAVQHSATRWCWKPGPAGASLVESVRHMAMEAGAEAAVQRDSLRLPLISNPALVQAVTDERVCARAVVAHRETFRPQLRARITQVFVIAVGPTRYVVWDGGYSRGGEFEFMHVYDSRFTHLGAFTS